MQENIDNIAGQIPYLQMGTGFVIGLSVGYVIKKSFKLILLLLGVGMILIFVLENKHIITIDESSLDAGVSAGTATFKEFAGFLQDRLGTLHISSSASALAGFLAGLKMG